MTLTTPKGKRKGDGTVIPNELAIRMELTRDMPAPDGWTCRGMDDFLLAHGRAWPVAADQTLPSDRFYAYPKQCFDNAYRLARRWPKRFRYVEGFAAGVIPMHHAWCVNADDEVVDPTWAAHSKVGTEYYGVAIPLDVAARVRHRGNVSILDNWQRGWPLFRVAWPATVDDVAAAMATAANQRRNRKPPPPELSV